MATKKITKVALNKKVEKIATVVDEGKKITKEAAKYTENLNLLKQNPILDLGRLELYRTKEELEDFDSPKYLNFMPDDLVEEIRQTAISYYTRKVQAAKVAVEEINKKIAELEAGDG